MNFRVNRTRFAATAVPATLFLYVLHRGLVPAVASSVVFAAWLTIRNHYSGDSGLKRLVHFLGLLAVLVSVSGWLHPDGLDQPRAVATTAKSGIVSGQVTSARLNPVDNVYTAVIRIGSRPVGFPTCVRATLARLPADGSRTWFRIEPRGHGACPWANAEFPADGYQIAVPAPDTSDYGGLRLLQLALTDGISLSGRDWQAIPAAVRLRQVGLGHLLAISGLHMGIVFVVIYLIARAGIRILPWRIASVVPAPITTNLSIALSLAGIWVFAAHTGLPPSAVRAAALITIAVVVRRVIQRRVHWDHLLIATVLLLVAVFPAITMTTGFAMSIAAVCFLTPLFVLPERLRWLAVAFLPGAGTAPFLLGFTSVSLVSPLANLVGVPIFSVWTFPVAAASRVAEVAGLDGFSSVLFDGFSYGVWILDRWSSFCLELWNQALQPADISGWSVSAYVLWCAVPVLATLAVERRRRLLKVHLDPNPG